MFGLFGWDTYYDASITGSANTTDVESSDQNVALDPEAAQR